MPNQSNKKPELCLERESEISRRQAVRKLLAEIRRTAPPWASCPPWQAEKLIRRQQHKELAKLVAIAERAGHDDRQTDWRLFESLKRKLQEIYRPGTPEYDRAHRLILNALEVRP